MPRPTKRMIDTAPDGYTKSDLGNAERIYDKYGNDILWCEEWDKWVIWSPTVAAIRDRFRAKRVEKESIPKWVIDRWLAAPLIALDSAREMHALDRLVPEDEKKSYHTFVKRSENKTGVRDALEILKTFVPSCADDFDASDYLLNCANGTLDLRKMSIHQPKREDLITKSLPIEWDPNAECPRWKEFLKYVMDGNDEVVEYLQRAAGYSLTGITQEQCFFLCTGHGGNGKGTFINTITRIVGDYGMTTPMSTFIEASGDSIPNDIARMKGARFVSAQEKAANRSFDESKLKTLTGEDPVSARFLRAEFFEYYPKFKIWMSMNGEPTIRGDDDGIWRRIRLIKWNVRLADKGIDKHFQVRLQEEYPGILRWMVEGARDWIQRGGLDEPEDVSRWTNEYRLAEDLIGQWIEDRCVISPDAYEYSSAMYRDFERWATDRNLKPHGQKRWSQRLDKRKGVEKRKTNGRVVFNGIGLRVDHSRENAGPLFRN